jgi:hypothetical protein
MPKHGDVRLEQGVLWQVYLVDDLTGSGEWVAIQDIELPSGVKALLPDTKTMTLMAVMDDSSIVDISGNIIKEAPSVSAQAQAPSATGQETGGTGQQGAGDPPPWWTPRMEMIKPWRTMGIIPADQTGGGKFDVSYFDADLKSVLSIAKGFGIDTTIPDTQGQEPSVRPPLQFSSAQEAQSAVHQARQATGQDWQVVPTRDGFFTIEPSTPEEQPQAQTPAGVIPGETFDPRLAGTYFIQDPDGSLRPFTPSEKDLPTFQQTVDGLMREWTITNDPAIRDQILRAESMRLYAERMRGLSWDIAVPLALQYGRTPAEVRQFLQVLMNPYGDMQVQVQVQQQAQRVVQQAQEQQATATTTGQAAAKQPALASMVSLASIPEDIRQLLPSDLASLPFVSDLTPQESNRLTLLMAQWQAQDLSVPGQAEADRLQVEMDTLLDPQLRAQAAKTPTPEELTGAPPPTPTRIGPLNQRPGLDFPIPSEEGAFASSLSTAPQRPTPLRFQEDIGEAEPFAVTLPPGSQNEQERSLWRRVQRLEGIMSSLDRSDATQRQQYMELASQRDALETERRGIVAPQMGHPTFKQNVQATTAAMNPTFSVGQVGNMNAIPGQFSTSLGSPLSPSFLTTLDEISRRKLSQESQKRFVSRGLPTVRRG